MGYICISSSDLSDDDEEIDVKIKPVGRSPINESCIIAFFKTTKKSLKIVPFLSYKNGIVNTSPKNICDPIQCNRYILTFSKFIYSLMSWAMLPWIAGHESEMLCACYLEKITGTPTNNHKSAKQLFKKIET